jgi:putative pyruvate formate lyase activating enzyme
MLCPRACGVNRIEGELGFCRTNSRARVFSFMPHHGEEPPVSGSRGSGTIFFSYCNLACVYCQNYEFSHFGQGKEVDATELAEYMLQLQRLGCHNINFVTPTHVLPQILKALEYAIPLGLTVPLVYNSSAYELPSVLKLLEGIVDIYLPDMRYALDAVAFRYSAAKEYVRYNRLSVKEMHRQVGVARIGDDGIIKSGMIIRHLVLPNALSGTKDCMDFISGELSPDSYVSLMSQYLPYHKAHACKAISRRLTEREYEQAKEDYQASGLYNGWVQESYGLERFAGVNIKSVFKKENA